MITEKEVYELVKEKAFMVRQLVEFHGFTRPEASHIVTFHSLLVMRLFGLERFKLNRCRTCGCLVEPPRIFCEEHAFTVKLGFDPKELNQ